MISIIRQAMVFRNAAAAVMGGLVFILTYITAAELSIQQLVAAIGGGAVLLFLVTGPIQYGMNEIWFRPFFRYIRTKEAGQRPGPGLVEEAYAGVTRFPLRSALVSLALWTIPTAAFVFVYLDHFGVSRRQQSYLWLALANAGLVGFVLQFYMFKRALAPVSKELAKDLKLLPVGYSSQALSLSIQSKMFMSFLSLLTFSLLFLTLLSFSTFEKVQVRHLADLGLSELSSLRHTLVPVRGLMPAEWGTALRGAKLTGGGRAFLSDLDGTRLFGPTIKVPALQINQAWTRTTDSDLMVATRMALPPVVLGIVYPRSEFVAVGDDFFWPALGVGLFTLAFGFAVAFLAAGDISIPLRKLAHILLRASRGNLSEPPAFMSEDEVGVLGRTIRTMIEKLRGQLMQVQGGASRMGLSARRTHTTARGIHAQSNSQLIDAEDADKVSTMIASNSEIMARETEGLRRGAGEVISFFSSLMEGMGKVGKANHDLRDSIQEFLPAVEKISALAEQVNGRTEELARFAEETAAATTEAHASARNVERLAHHGSALIQEVRETATQGEESIRSISTGIGKIRGAGENVLTLIEELDGLFKEVKWIIRLIGEVAEDADILALNAEIISEQVGRRGGGFSIVAREIGSLAHNTQIYTRTVTGHLSRIEGMEKNTLSKVEEMNKVIQEAIFYANELSKTFHHVLEQTQLNATVSSEISNACREQAIGSERITTAMAQMNRTVERISEDAGKQQVSCERIRSIAETLGRESTALSGQSDGQRVLSEEARSILAPIIQLSESVGHSTEGQQREMVVFREKVGRMREISFGNARTADQLEESCSRIESRAQALEAEVARVYFEKS